MKLMHYPSRLCKAAPDLLAACETILFQADMSLADQSEDEQPYAEIFRETVEKVRAAVAKAKGEK